MTWEQRPTGPARGPWTVDETAISAARSKVGAAAQATVAAIRVFAERATALLGAPVALRASARHQTEILNAGQVATRLRETPVTVLRDVTGRGTRIGRLHESGYQSVADVLAASPYELTSVQGVGPHTAVEVSEAARVAAARIAKDTKLRLDPDRRDPGQTQLLATLAAIRQADSAVSTLRAPLRQFTAQTTPLVAEAERASSRWRMFFSGGAKKRSALTALAQLDAVLADPRTVALQQTVETQQRAIDPRSYAPDKLWHDYAADAASVNALLSTVGGAGETDDKEAAEGFIPPELRQEISAIPLDTSLLTATLRGYQLFGAQYAIHQKRSMLGDEMGLGKTVEALAVLTHMAAKGQRRFLVVCPASVQINWLKEIAKHTRLAGHSLHGSDRDAATRRWMRTGGVGITTFGTLGKLKGVKHDEIAMLVVDEAHLVKNPDAQRSQAVQTAANQAQRALFLSGTPMENRVEEFRNLIGYLQPRVASRVDASDTLAGAKAFRRAVAPVYLRRNQEDVLTELPDKIEVEDWVQLSDDDEVAYANAVRSRNLMAMRQAAYRSPSSAKLERLVEIVEESAEDGFKVVVFSYFLGVLDAVQWAARSPVTGVITGKVPSAQRQAIVDQFTRQEGHALLLSQIDAGGVGLNIQAANIVILAEPQWKPSTEEQAIARAFRMGQIRKVLVHRLLAKGSVDERLREIQEQKALLFDEFARKSDAKDADRRAVDTSEHRPAILDDRAVPLERRVIMAEEHRLGIR